MLRWLKEELGVKKFSLRLEDVEVFTTSSIFPSFVLLIIRLALTVFCIVCLVCSGVQDSDGTTKWFIYLTNWSYTLLTLTFILLSSLSAYPLYHGWRNRFQEPGYQGGNYGSFDVPEDVKMKNASEVSVSIRRHERKRETLPPWAFMMLRSAMALFCVVITIGSGVRSNSPKWFIYLTVWSYLLLTMSSLGLSFLSLIHCVNQMKLNGRDPSEDCFDGRASLKEDNVGNEATRNIENQDNITDEHERTFHVKLIWLFWIFSSASALLVALLYWTMVFESPTSFIDISVHALNVMFVLAELFLGAIPVHLLHGLYVMAISGIYAAFTVIYWATGGLDLFGNRFIYNPINYEGGHPAYVAGTVLGSIFVIIPLMQLVRFLLYQLRHYLRRKISGSCL